MGAEFFFLLVLVAVEKTGSAAKPGLTFRPNYGTIFVGEKIKMTCNSKPKEKEYSWLQNNRVVAKAEFYEIPNAQTSNSGNYQCQTSTGMTSEVVKLNVVPDQVILQAPPYIVEGDRLTLKCHNSPSLKPKRCAFYKDQTEIKEWNSEMQYSVPGITRDASGSYSCIIEIQDLGNLKLTATASIHVTELFTTPEIQVTRTPGEGGKKRLTCNSTISPYKADTVLTYGFYKDKQIIQKFGPTNEFEVQDTLPRTYSCSVRPTTSRLTKESKAVLVGSSDGLMTSQWLLMAALAFFFMI